MSDFCSHRYFVGAGGAGGGGAHLWVQSLSLPKVPVGEIAQVFVTLSQAYFSFGVTKSHPAHHCSPWHWAQQSSADAAAAFFWGALSNWRLVFGGPVVHVGEGGVETALQCVAYIRNRTIWEGFPSDRYLEACHRNIGQFWPLLDGDGTVHATAARVESQPQRCSGRVAGFVARAD